MPSIMYKFSPIILLLGVYLSSGYACNVIPAEESIDWSRMEGTVWYQVMNSGDAENIAASCHVIKFLKSEKDTVYTNFFLLDDSNPEKIDVTEQQFTKAGKFYNMNAANEADWMEISVEREKEKNPKLIAEVVHEMEDRFTYPIALYTDYETYFIGARCTPENHYVFIYSSSPQLTSPVALKIFNILAKYNNAIALTLAGCKDIKNIEN